MEYREKTANAAARPWRDQWDEESEYQTIPK